MAGTRGSSFHAPIVLNRLRHPIIGLRPNCLYQTAPSRNKSRRAGVVPDAMRKLTEPQAHRGRVDVIEGRFPPGMKSRCAWCRAVASVEEGQFVDVKRSAQGATKLFKCPDCLSRDESAA